MTNLLTVENAVQYLENMEFTQIQFSGENNDCLYFMATDEENNLKFVEFEALDDQIIVSTSNRPTGEWTIFETFSIND